MAIANALVTGVREAKLQMERIPDVVRARIADAQIRTGSAIAIKASARARRRSGALAEAIGYEHDERTTTTRVGIRRGTFRGHRPGPRGHLIEFGTRKAPAFPFMMPAVESEQGNYLNRLKEAGAQIERDLSVGRFL